MSRIEEIMNIEGFKKLTPIQESVVHRKDPDRDLVGISSTGSGKSHAFFLPVFDKIDPSRDQVQAVISVPTRELAYQLYERAKNLAAHFGIRVKLVTGGMDRHKVGTQKPHLVIGTPGRMKDLFLDDKTLRLDTAKVMIIDEADMTMEFGFLEDVDQILSKMGEDTQLMVFSATIPENLQPFLKKYLHNPEIITIDTNEEFQSDVTNYLVPARHMSYEEKLLQILPAINPYIALIFANTTEEAAQVAEGMRREGYDLVELHSGMESRARAQAIRQIQSQKKSYIVASDIASRGIDLEGISHVISLGFPKDLKFFFHRIGRTGRAGRDGLAITIYQDSDRRSIDSLAHKGVQWKHKDVKRGQWVDLKPLEGRRRKGTDPLQAEISRIVKAGKKERVKPNYKKKQKQQIEQLRRKRKRQIIQEDIRRQKKERAKEKQKARRQGSK